MSASQIAQEVGWDDGLEIPVANVENKQLTTQLQQLRRQHDQKSGEADNLQVKVKNLSSHLKTVREELQNTLQMRNTRKKELDTEKHFTVVSEHENSRLSQLIRTLEKQLEDQREQRNTFENKIYTTNSKVEQLKNQMQWDQHALEAWLEESARRDEDSLVIQRFQKQDDSKIKELQLSIEKLTEERNNARKALETETTETLSAQLELEKIAEEFRGAHIARQELISQWESSLNSMRQRDMEIKDEEDNVESIREEITARQLMLKEKRAFLETESENNKELEKKIEIKERQNSKLRQQKIYFEERTTQLEDDVKTLQYQSDRSRKENESQIVMVNSFKNQYKQMEGKLSNMQGEMRDIEEKTDNTRKGHLSAADASTQAERILTENELILKEKDATNVRCRNVAFRKHQEHQNTVVELKAKELELYGAKAGLRNLKQHLIKLDHESIKTQEIIYNQDFNIAQTERRIARLHGEVNSEEKQVILAKRNKLLSRVEEKQDKKRVIDEQIRKLQENSRRVKVTLDKCTKEHTYVCDKIEELELYDESSHRAHRNLIGEKQQLMVENAILKLKVKKAEELADSHLRGIVDLENHKIRIETALKERRVEIDQHYQLGQRSIQNCGLLIQQTNFQLYANQEKVEVLKKRFEIINMQLKAPEGQEDQSQAYHVIQAAQKKESLKRHGDVLHAQIKKAENEVEGLENTLQIINGGNERLRHSLRHVGEDSSEQNELDQLDRSRRTVVETLRHKNHIMNELEDDIIAKEHTLRRHEEEMIRTQAKIDDQNCKRQQLQKEVDKSDERLSRVNDRLSRLEKNVVKSSAALQYSAEFIEGDVQIKALRELSKETLKSIGKVRDQQPEVGMEIEDSLASGGLRIPTPSSTGSPASSARLSTSRSSLASRSSKGSVQTARSGSLATTTVQLGLSDVQAPPNSANSSRAGTARSTRKSKKTLDKL